MIKSPYHGQTCNIKSPSYAPPPPQRLNIDRCISTKKSSDVLFITKQIGSAIVVDVIKFDPVSMEAIVRVKERYVVPSPVGLHLNHLTFIISHFFADKECTEN